MENYTQECGKEGLPRTARKPVTVPCKNEKGRCLAAFWTQAGAGSDGGEHGAPKLCLRVCPTPASRPWLLRQSLQFPQPPPLASDGPTGPGETLPQT